MPFECWFLRWMRHYTKSRFGDYFMPRVTRLGDYGALWIAMALVMLCFRRTRQPAVQMLLALAVESLLCNTLLKPLIGRPRPFELSSRVRPLIPPPSDRSFRRDIPPPPSPPRPACGSPVRLCGRQRSPWRFSSPGPGCTSASIS